MFASGALSFSHLFFYFDIQGQNEILQGLHACVLHPVTGDNLFLNGLHRYVELIAWLCSLSRQIIYAIPVLSK